MANVKKEQDFSRQIYGSTVEEITNEYGELMTQYRIHVVKELGKFLRNELKDAVPPAYIEFVSTFITHFT